MEHVIHEKKNQTPTHIIFDGHTWIKNTAVNSCCFIGICQRDPNFNLNLHYQVYQGTCTCTVHTVKIVKSTMANIWFPIFFVCKFFPLVYSEFVMT